jgi:hypothetical protein
MSLHFVEADEFKPFKLNAQQGVVAERIRGVAEKAGNPSDDADEPTKQARRRHLNLYLNPDGKGEHRMQPHAHCMVGQVWLKEDDRTATDIVLRVESKVAKASAIGMYAACLSDPVVRAHLEKAVTLFWDDDPIPGGDPEAQITPLIVARYLSLLYDLCQKHLRSAIHPIEENLVGRIRGRPFVQQTIRRNLARGRPDRVYCRYQVQSLDTVPNRILLAALRQGMKYLDQRGLRLDGLSRLAAFCLDALNSVSLRRIASADFQGLHYAGFMRPYKEPHSWAKLILKQLGYDPHEELRKPIALPPFAIDMNELFERYCEVLLRKGSHQKIWAGYHDCNLGTALKVRPDFLIQSGDKGFIVDAKYKERWHCVNWLAVANPVKGDIMQVVGYSRHCGVLEKLRKLGLEPPSVPHVAILYPRHEGDPLNQLNLGASWPPENQVFGEFQVKIARIAIPLPRRP